MKDNYDETTKHLMSFSDQLKKRIGIQPQLTRMDEKIIADLMDDAIALLTRYREGLELIAHAELGAIPDAIAADFQAYAAQTIGDSDD